MGSSSTVETLCNNALQIHVYYSLLYLHFILNVVSRPCVTLNDLDVCQAELEQQVAAHKDVQQLLQSENEELQQFVAKLRHDLVCVGTKFSLVTSLMLLLDSNHNNNNTTTQKKTTIILKQKLTARE